MPAPIDSSLCFFSRTLCLGKVFQSWFFKGIGQPAKPFATVQESTCFFICLLTPPSHQVNAEVVFASKSINIHSVACSPTICWFILMGGESVWIPTKHLFHLSLFCKVCPVLPPACFHLEVLYHCSYYQQYFIYISNYFTGPFLPLSPSLPFQRKTKIFSSPGSQESALPMRLQIQTQ